MSTWRRFACLVWTKGRGRKPPWIATATAIAIGVTARRPSFRSAHEHEPRRPMTTRDLALSDAFVPKTVEEPRRRWHSRASRPTLPSRPGRPAKGSGCR